MNYRTISLGVILIAVTATSFEASAASRGAAGGVTVKPSPIVRGSSSQVYQRTVVGGKKVIREGRNYDKTPTRVQVIVNGKRVPRKI